MSLNKTILLGRLTRDPEIRRTQNGTTCASFTIAVDRDYRDQSGERGVDFIDCVAWRQTGDFVADYLSKGRQIAVDGRLQQRRWTAKDGTNRSTIEVVADHVYFADSKPGMPQGTIPGGVPVTPPTDEPYSQQAIQDAYNDLYGDDDELPY